MDIMLTTRYLDDLAGLGVTIPEQSSNARAIYEAALIAANAQPSNDLKAALEDGQVTPQNVGEFVHRAALDLGAKQNAHQIVIDLQHALHKSIKQGLRDHAPRIITELRATFRPAAEQITEAAKLFGPGTTAEDIITGKPAVVAAWKQATASARTLDIVSGAYRRLLSEVLRDLPSDLLMHSLFVTGKAVDLDHAHNLYRDREKWLALAHAGFTLRLNSPDEARSVVAGAEAVKAKQAAAERELMLVEHRRMYMPVGLG